MVRQPILFGGTVLAAVSAGLTAGAFALLSPPHVVSSQSLSPYGGPAAPVVVVVPSTKVLPHRAQISAQPLLSSLTNILAQPTVTNVGVTATRPSLSTLLVSPLTKVATLAPRAVLAPVHKTIAKVSSTTSHTPATKVSPLPVTAPKLTQPSKTPRVVTSTPVVSAPADPAQGSGNNQSPVKHATKTKHTHHPKHSKSGQQRGRGGQAGQGDD